MLSIFPQLLFLSPFSATMLRLFSGFTFAWLAYTHEGDHRAASEELSRLIGGASLILHFYALVELIIGLSLIAGVGTQLAALVGFGIALKMVFIRKSLRELRPLTTYSYALLAVVCLSLVFTGAGAFAFDLPL